MADYYPLIARAVAGLDKNTGENRRALYERARTALVAQLRGVDPPLEETEVTRERLALEESIRKVEAEAARRARTEAVSRTASRAAARARAPPPLQHPPAGDAAPQRPAIRRRRLSSTAAVAAPAPPPLAPAASAPTRARRHRRSSAAAARAAASGAAAAAGSPAAAFRTAPRAASPLRRSRRRRARRCVRVGLRSGSGSRRDAARFRRRAARKRPPHDPFADLPAAHDFDRLDDGPQPRIDPRALRSRRATNRSHSISSRRLSTGEEPPKRGRILARKQPAQDDAPEGLGRSYGGIIKAAIAVVLLVGLVGFGYWQRSTLVGSLSGVARLAASQATRPAATPAGSQSQPKIADRIGQPTQQRAGPAVAQRVVLYEEEPSDPQGKRYVGSAIWRTETVSPGPGQPPELAVRADVEIPERRITMKFSIRRNTDNTLPASHTVEIMFNLPPDFAGGGIANVPGILMKQTEQTRGVPLAGLAVKVMTGFFLIGLSATEADLQRNIQLLKERAWFDIPGGLRQ